MKSHLSFKVFTMLLMLTNLISCTLIEKEPNDQSTDTVSIKFMKAYTDEELSLDTVYVSSDLDVSFRALIAPAGKVTKARFKILGDYTEFLKKEYVVKATNEQGYLIDSIMYHFNYSDLAGLFNFVTIQVEADISDGETIENHLTYKIQPKNFPFLAHFYDFNDSDTLTVGSTVTILPFFSPMLTTQNIATMNVFRKIGFAQEVPAGEFTGADFYYYQTGFLREYTYEVPYLPIGTGITHRFEISTNQGARYVLQHKILVK